MSKKSSPNPLVILLGVILGIVVFVAIFAGFALLGGLITWAVWNLLAVPVFHALGWAAFPKIGFWLAVGINIIWGIVTAPFRSRQAVTSTS